VTIFGVGIYKDLIKKQRFLTLKEMLEKHEDCKECPIWCKDCQCGWRAFDRQSDIQFYRIVLRFIAIIIISPYLLAWLGFVLVHLFA
jgi:hypothetical protein